MNDGSNDGAERSAVHGLTRRQALRDAAAVGAGAVLAAGAGVVPGAAAQDTQGANATPAAPGVFSDELLHGLETDIRTAMETFGITGAAIALVQGDEIVHSAGFG
ncbi:MAG: hypothetical protein IT337_17185, partial [Thermomicrobiales bacterium]|nr:hypothetical protein [Thermomicrobiales bacterium]